MIARPAVLDSWAIVAALQDEEPAKTVVQALLRRGRAGNARVLMCLVNLGEVYYRVAHRHGEARAQLEIERMRRVPIEFLQVRETLAIEAARLKSRHGFGYADAFAVATARHEDAPLYTGDPGILARAAGVVAIRRLVRD